ncbi:MAG: hypothetical protein ACP5SI_08770 [Chloroflexia bacterium]
MKRVVLLGLVGVLVLGACGTTGEPPSSTTTPTPTSTRSATPASSPTATPTPVVAGPAPTQPTQAALCPEYELEIELWVSQSYEEFRAEFGGSGHIPLTADLSQDPPEVTGAGEVPISGSGTAGDCTLSYSGSFAYTISGEIVQDQGAARLHLVGQCEGHIAVSSSCGAGGGGPAAPERWEMWLPYQDGATESYTATVPGTTAESTWRLDILCEP